MTVSIQYESICFGKHIFRSVFIGAMNVKFNKGLSNQMLNEIFFVFHGGLRFCFILLYMAISTIHPQLSRGEYNKKVRASSNSF